MKIKYLIVTVLTFFICSGSALASYTINSIDVDISINEDGSANVTEVWDVKVSSGTEIFKSFTDLGNMTLIDFKVYENNNEYELVPKWDIKGTLDSKKNKNGINSTSNGMELCWGMGSYGNHVYTIKYKLINFVFNTSDAQVVYYKAINDSMDPAPKSITVDITGYYEFPDTLDVWGYGYDGYAYVKNGKIELASKENSFNSGEYAVVLIKFPLNTFTNKVSTKYSTFNDVLNKANEGAVSSKDDNDENDIFSTIFGIFWFLFVISSVFFGAKSSGSKYKLDGKTAKMSDKDLPPFRDIPCNGNFYRANIITKVFNMGNKKENIIGSILLNWLLADKISIINLPDTTFKKNRIAIDLKDITQFTNGSEQELYEIMREASEDNILETNELEKWCKKNYKKLFDWVEKLEKRENERLINENLVQSEKKYLSTVYNVQPNLVSEGQKVFGMRKFLREFSNIKEKQPIEVKLWKEYLIYAQIFGIADKVAKQFKDLYPEIRDIADNDFDTMIYNIHIVNIMTTSGLSAADRAREAAASSYSSGGGGFSSFGGGGGSFGGGSGGGCR